MSMNIPEEGVVCQCIEIVKDVLNGNLILGFAIGGGIDQDASKNPFCPGDTGIFVTRVTQDGPADRQGLRVGDKILQVNGYDLTFATQNQAKKKLVKDQRIVRLKVTRPSLMKATVYERQESPQHQPSRQESPQQPPEYV